MSQVQVSSTSGTPSVPTSFTTDVDSAGNPGGTATPVGNVLQVLGSYTSDNDDNGIRTKADGDTVYFELTNRLFGTGTTTSDTTADLITFDLGATDQAFVIWVRIVGRVSVGFKTSTVGYKLEGTFSTDGATARRIDLDLVNDDEDDPGEGGPINLDPANATILVDGNNTIVRVTGVSSTVMTWKAMGGYIQI